MGRFCCNGCVVGVFTVTLVLSYSANENFNVTHTQTPSRQIKAVITLNPKNTQEHNDTHRHRLHSQRACTNQQTNINGFEVSQAKTLQKYHVLHLHTVASIVRNTGKRENEGHPDNSLYRTSPWTNLTVEAATVIFWAKHFLHLSDMNEPKVEEGAVLTV